MDSPRATETELFAREAPSRPASPPPGMGTQEPPETLRAEATTPAAVGQWGPASLLLSCVMLLMVPLVLIVLTLIPMSVAAVPFWDTPSLIAASVFMPLGGLIMTFLSLFTLAFDLAGWASARSRRESRAPHVAATAVGAVALLCWLAVAVQTFILAFGIWNIH